MFVLKCILIVVGCVFLGATICAMALGLTWTSTIGSLFTVGVWYAISHIDDPEDDDGSDDCDPED